MRLQRLEIHGFKSFSDRSELAFDKGVTAIVGPNGCGKSNVADAITWVMGEQSAKSLRGERMEDVLFSGSDARKPTASAEVRLRFSGVVKSVTGPAFSTGGDGSAEHVSGNGHGASDATAGNGHGHDPIAGNGHDQTSAAGQSGSRLEEVAEIIQSVAREVEVTRRLYRSGESEYLIDGQMCRLRDVHELLMDTGLGAKAYAIIEQGKIGMILSTRPTDRRQLIEEAAGVTKYKTRRRMAALKLEAAQQNLLRIDDIVFEVEKQRGALKRQAARARRYQKLRDEMRRWEKILFTRRYRRLAGTVESVRSRLTEAREQESLAAAGLAEAESSLARRRIELTESESRALQAREAAHVRELEINRLQQQLAFDREQRQSLGERATGMAAELELLQARHEPARAALEDRRAAWAGAEAERDRRAAALAADLEAHDSAHREIEGLEADVEAARSEVFSAINSATALRHALEHASAARERVAETIAKLDVESTDLRIETDRAATERAEVAASLRQARTVLEGAQMAHAARASDLASARIEHEWRARAVRAREHELAALDARLKSLEELEAARAGYGDAARAVLAQANGSIGQAGAVADFLEVEAGLERAVEACLGDRLQLVIVERPEQAAAGFELVRRQGAGRCGFLMTSRAPAPTSTQEATSDGSVPGTAPDSAPGTAPGTALGTWHPAQHVAPSTQHLAPGAERRTQHPAPVRLLSSAVRVNGPFAEVIRQSIADAWIVDSYEQALDASSLTDLAVVSRAGDVFRGPHLVTGGGRDEGRGILETKREIRDARARLQSGREALRRLVEETTALEAAIAQASTAMDALEAERHAHEKAIVGHEIRLQRATDEAGRLASREEQLARERRQAEEERDGLDRRQDEARAAITRLEEDQRLADERLSAAQRRLLEAREATEDLSLRAAEARAAHAALVERAAALAIEVRRLEEADRELEAREAVLTAEIEQCTRRIVELGSAIAGGESHLDANLRSLDTERADLRTAEDAAAVLRAEADRQEDRIKEARASVDSVRAMVAELDLGRATAEADLAHLAASCVEALQATLDEIRAEVDQFEDQLERDGSMPDRRAIRSAARQESRRSAESGESGESGDRSEPGDAPDLLESGESDELRELGGEPCSAEEAIAALRARIEGLGPVNMMAIDQFDELESRHAFLTTQRRDLVDSIAQTTEAIKRIDETTRRRFADAFAAINRNFQETFSTLFGGGRAGLALLDESDPLESGIEIIAQPPGKRLQSVQLLSGGEKALTAIALMFGLFKYKPSPFCLLDEIDAPLDDANIGRFVEMLRGMLAHTQFILITHNRKTMEIADRLYGVTMEEPGVSKLISVQLN